jgi:catechol 2,3-dioxygenase-like lactoylglutathione lyase family enzyme
MSEQALRIGHVGLFVRDIERMIAFYRDVLGFVVTDRAERICFLSRDPDQHHQVVFAPGRPQEGHDSVQQLSFRVETLEEVLEIHRRLVAADAKALDPCTHGNAWSVYFRDPEGNRTEFYCDTPWHISQPFRKPMNYDQPKERIYAETLAICEASPGFKPMAQYKKELAERLAAGRTAH